MDLKGIYNRAERASERFSSLIFSVFRSEAEASGGEDPHQSGTNFENVEHAVEPAEAERYRVRRHFKRLPE